MKNNKIKVFVSLVAASTAAAPVFAVSSCSKTINIERIDFKQQYSYVEVGTRRNFSQEVQLTPENANTGLVWSIRDSNDDSIATVESETGIVTGLAPGYVRLVCSSKIDASILSVQWVLVGEYKPLEGFEISDSIKTIEIGSTYTLQTKFEPADATSAKTEYVKWTSSNTDVATVDNYGKITSKKVGTTTITAVPYDYDIYSKEIVPKEDLTRTCIVSVEYAKPQEVWVRPSSIVVEPNSEFKVVPTVLPVGADPECKYSISDPSIITSYDPETGIAKTGNQLGTATIFFESVADQSKIGHCSVTVKNSVVQVESISFVETTHSMKANESFKPTIKVLPENAEYQGYTLETSDPEIAEVSQSDVTKIIGKKPGTVTLTVTSQDGIHKGTNTCELTVEKVPVENVVLPITEVTCKENSTVTINGYVEPIDATYKDIEWTSSNPIVATVDKTKGTITGLKTGTSTITATSTDDPTKSAQCTVTVTEDFKYISKLTIAEEIDCKMGETPIINIAVEPSDASHKFLNWRVLDNSVLSIQQISATQAKIFPKKIGKTRIYAISTDGSFASTNMCDVTVGSADITKFELFEHVISLPRTGRTQLSKPVIEPSSAVQDVVWSSSDPGVATIDTVGKVQAIKPGETTITCTSKGFDAQGAHPTDTCRIAVTTDVVPVTRIELEFTKQTITLENPQSLPNVKFFPEYATTQTVMWTAESGKEDYVSIDERNKKLTGLKEGKVTLTCTALGGTQAVAYLDVTIAKPEPEQIDPYSYPKTMSRGQTAQIMCNVKPWNASQEVVYESITPDVLDVTADGQVTTKRQGIGKIKISSKVKPSVYTEIEIYSNWYLSFSDDSWGSVCEVANMSTYDLHQRYKADCDSNKQFPGTLIGYTRKIKFNGFDHVVRVIGENHDDKADGTGKKAPLTFEVVTLLTNKDKKLLTTPFEPSNRGIKEYSNSTLRFNLTGTGSPKIHEGCAWEKTAIDIIRDENPDLYKNIKRATKNVCTDVFQSEKLESISDFIWPLARFEISGNTEGFAEKEGPMYEYYKKHSKKNDRKKRAFKHKNSATYFLRSVPSAVVEDGSVVWLNRKELYYGVSFAFCI